MVLKMQHSLPVQIGAAFNKDLKEQYVQYRKDMAEKVLAENNAETTRRYSIIIM